MQSSGSSKELQNSLGHYQKSATLKQQRQADEKKELEHVDFIRSYCKTVRIFILTFHAHYAVCAYFYRTVLHLWMTSFVRILPPWHFVNMWKSMQSISGKDHIRLVLTLV